MKKIKILLLFIISLVLTSSQKTDIDYFEISKNLKLVSSIYEKINTHYVDEVLPGRVMKKGIDAMLKSLDPYTIYISEEQIEDFRFATTGEYGGIGATIKKKKNKAIVSELYEGSPATKSEILPGDEIISIDEIIIKDKTLEETGNLLKGPASSTVNIKIRRNNNEYLKKVQREKIQIPAVNFTQKVNKNTGIIKLTSFTNTAALEFKKALIELQKQEIKNLIIDLRSNGGGLLNEAVKIVNFFIPKGQEVVSTKSRLKEMNRTYLTQLPPIAENLKLVVLIDEYSASASEIVAGSLQDLDKAVIVGQTSFGKGLVQQTKPVSFGGQIKLTVAKYYTPSGRCIQKLDYSSMEGSSKEIEDSLVKKFTTRNGRNVTDSRGVEPDVSIKEEYFSIITQNLLLKDVIFEFVNRTIGRYDSIELNPTKFTLPDSAFLSFLDFAKTKNINYETESSLQLKELKKTAKKEKYDLENQELFYLLDSVFKVNFEKDAMKNREEIQFFIENEMVSRKYFQRGRMLASMDKDPYTKEAVKILNDLDRYNKILGNK